MRFELHCHSTCSDGTESPVEVARRAAERGIEVFALTDHDTCAGTAAAALPSARTLRAVELTCAVADRIVHLLVYDRGGAWSAIEEQLDAIRTSRRARLVIMGERLAARGIHVDLAPLLDSGRSVGRPDLARALVELGVSATPREAFSEHLHDGGPVDEPHRVLSIDDALAAARAAGAAVSLAHPHFYNEQAAPLLRRYRDDGLSGVEAFYGIYDQAQRRRFVALADELGLVCTGGSDWHGTEKAGAQMSSTSNCELGVDIPTRRTDALLRWLS